jgi:hypothetical protein
MKRVIASAVLAGLLLCAGCFTAAPPKIADPEPTPIAEPKAPPPVTPDQINAQNAQDKAQALSEEIDFEMHRATLKTPRE